ncbi:MAG TPA: hypothetical protein DDW49_02285 [Deltaproteobacteria bacterium]|nr:MAG: hypothetical protein A2048_06755 [Deltaproteobacteria bacterium GWA2_45_12]HBF12212.1 hypothetical protein [Deltaproteobacteria bacterium]
MFPLVRNSNALPFTHFVPVRVGPRSLATGLRRTVASSPFGKPLSCPVSVKAVPFGESPLSGARPYAVGLPGEQQQLENLGVIMGGSLIAGEERGWVHPALKSHDMVFMNDGVNQSITSSGPQRLSRDDLTARGFTDPDAILAATGGYKDIVDAAFLVKSRTDAVPSMELLLILAHCQQSVLPINDKSQANWLKEAVILLQKGVPLGHLRGVIFRGGFEHVMEAGISSEFYAFVDALQSHISGNRREHWMKVFDVLQRMIIDINRLIQSDYLTADKKISYQDVVGLMQGLKEAQVGKDHWPLVISYLWSQYTVSEVSCPQVGESLHPFDLSLVLEAILLQRETRNPFEIIFRRLSLSKEFGVEIADAVLNFNLSLEHDRGLASKMREKGIEAVVEDPNLTQESPESKTQDKAPSPEIPPLILDLRADGRKLDWARHRKFFYQDKGDHVVVEFILDETSLVIDEIQYDPDNIPGWQQQSLQWVEGLAKGRGYKRIFLNTPFNLFGRLLPRGSVKNLDRVYRQVPQAEGWKLVCEDSLPDRIRGGGSLRGRYYWVKDLVG